MNADLIRAPPRWAEAAATCICSVALPALPVSLTNGGGVRPPRAHRGPFMNSPLTLKLQHGAFLNAEDCARLDAVIAAPRSVPAHTDIIEEGDAPENVHLVLDGWAYRYKTLPDGKRQIMAFLIPGDFCDLHIAVLGRMDHGIATFVPTTVVDIPKPTVHELTFNHPRIAQALWWATLVDEAILREWLVSMGQRPADRQMAHLFCELFARLEVVGLTDKNSFPLRDAPGRFGRRARNFQRSRQPDAAISARRRSHRTPAPDRSYSKPGAPD